jgi:3D (Asp-Asp-Asp) domain-containing protein
MKSLLGGSAALTVALCAGSFLLNTRPIVAEANIPQPQPTPFQQKSTNANLAIASSTEDLSAAKVSDNFVPVEDSMVLDDAPIAPYAADTIASRASETMAEASIPITAAQNYIATAYSLNGRTASGLRTTKGIIAADHSVLPLGSRVRIEAGTYSGEYLVADTGGGVRGRRIDVWVPSTPEACRFGRRSVRLTVLSYGRNRTAARSPRRR